MIDLRLSVSSLLLATLVALPAQTRELVAVAANASAPERISEAMFVSIGGIPQWITIKGEDHDNPVVLFLHGGPGDALSPYADSMFTGWDRDFTLVQWDQRGAGRTFTKSGPSVESSMTMERMTQDGIDVAEYLIKHLHKKKIILLGGSWGSILGIHMAHARPDLFYAYVGSAQIVNYQKGLSVAYARVLGMARADGNQQAIHALTEIGPPPWHSVFTWPIYRKWERLYQAKLVTAPSPTVSVGSEYASAQERAQYDAADDFSFLHFWGPTLSGPLMKVNLPALGTTFDLPIFIVQGQEDLTAPPELAKAYVERIHAPRKQFYLVAGTGHEDSVASLHLMLKILEEQVRPLANASGL
ncbi:MAG: alpha/beta hydrolase [Acidobacteriaceae bacterium]